MDEDYEGQAIHEEVARNYLEKSTASGLSLGGHLRNPPVRKIVESQIAEYERLIKVRQDFLAKLDENKGVEEVLDMLRKIGI